MIFITLEKKEELVSSFYKATWEYGYDFMLCFFQRLINGDFQGHVDYAFTGGKDEQIDIKEELINHNLRLKNCPSVKEDCGFISIAGYSQTTSSNIRITLWTNTNRVQIEIMNNSKMLEDNGPRIFDNFLNSVEILAYMDLAVKSYIKNNASAQSASDTTHLN